LKIFFGYDYEKDKTTITLDHWYGVSFFWECEWYHWHCIRAI